MFDNAYHYKFFSENSKLLQEDLDELTNWSDTNNIRFQDSKCQILSFKNSFDICKRDKKLSSTTSQKESGIIIKNKLRWHRYSERKKSKA